ncbi:MAG: RNA 3'-terminal phosphate cyclase [Candidatus Diapherotrites archaeon]|nr:RNA 3'-terminal phosphate cyclase [Candidatus Diapherotrites archaeon]
MLTIDGSAGEGGGQILRTSLALACLTGKEIRIENIRAKRKKPGLRPQHLTAVKTLAKICNAKVKGAYIGSSMLTFKPGKIEDASLVANIGTAGSISLLLQQVLPVSLACNLKLRAFGGTDVSFAPTVNYTRKVTFYYLHKMGAELALDIVARGYFPKGNGCVLFTSKPSLPLKPIRLRTLGRLHAIECFAHCSGMATKVAKDAASIAKNTLKENLGSFEWVEHIEATPERKETVGLGIDLFAKYTNCILGANAVGIAGTRPETLARTASKNLMDEISMLAPVDSHCVDQLIPFMALAKGKSVIEGRLTKHAVTNIYITEKLLDVEFKVETNNERARINVDGVGFTI